MKAIRWREEYDSARRPRPRLFCGPAAIALTMGVTAEEAIEVARKVVSAGRITKKTKTVRAMYYGEVCAAIRMLGGEVRDVALRKRPPIYKPDEGGADYAIDRIGRCRSTTYRRSAGETLRDFVTRTVRTGKTFIVASTNHYMAVEGAMFADTGERRPRWAFDADISKRYLSRRIVFAIEVRRDA